VLRGALEYMQQYNGRTIKHAFSWLWAMRIAWERYIKVIDHG
jgi:hypothetical protein